MLNLHPPFRRGRPDDAQAVAALAASQGRLTVASHGAFDAAGTVVAEEGGAIRAVLVGAPADAESWQIDLLAVTPDRAAELLPRILAVADALAADEGLASVRLRLGELAPGVAALLDQEGFRPAGSPQVLARPVVPQG
jgi:hypothetical protein